MHATAVKRKVHRAESILKWTLNAQVKVAAISVWNNRICSVHKAVVVVTHNLEYRHTHLVGVHRIAHIVEHILLVGRATHRDNIAQSDTIAWYRLLLRVAFNLWGNLRLETLYRSIGATLRVGKAEEQELILNTASKWFQRKVVARMEWVDTLEIARTTILIFRNLISFRNDVEDVVSVFIVGHLVATIRIGCGNLNSVGNGYALQRITRVILHITK